MRYIHEVGVDTAQNSLMGDDQDVLAPLQFHDDRLETYHNVAIRLATQIAVVKFVFVALFEIFGILVFDLSICQAVAYTRVKLVQGLPLQFLKGQEAGSLYRASQCRSPDSELPSITDRLPDELRQFLGVGLSTFRENCIASDLACQIIFGLAVLFVSAVRPRDLEADVPVKAISIVA